MSGLLKQNNEDKMIFQLKSSYTFNLTNFSDVFEKSSPFEMVLVRVEDEML